MVKLLSSGNLAVLDAIKRHKPTSIRELATITGRKEASLSRTLKRFAQLGIVAFEDGPRRARVPALVATRVYLEIALQRHCRRWPTLKGNRDRQAPTPGSTGESVGRFILGEDCETQEYARRPGAEMSDDRMADANSTRPS
jgi:DNA-binding MarR family transcriptional regulator